MTNLTGPVSSPIPDLLVQCYELNYRPQRSWGNVIFSEECAKNSVHSGVCPVACWDTPPRPEADPLGPEASTPRTTGRQPPRADPSRADTPFSTVHAGRYGQQAGGMHPTGMHTCCIVKFNKTLKEKCSLKSCFWCAIHYLS